MSAPDANTPALRTLALWDLAEPMARLLLEIDDENSSGCCWSCGAARPDEEHSGKCPWSPGGLIERIRALMPEKEES